MGSCITKEGNGKNNSSPDKRGSKYEVKGNQQKQPDSKAGQVGKFSFEKKKRDLSNFQFLNESDKLLVKEPGYVSIL